MLFASISYRRDHSNWNYFNISLCFLAFIRCQWQIHWICLRFSCDLIKSYTHRLLQLFIWSKLNVDKELQTHLFFIFIVSWLYCTACTISSNIVSNQLSHMQSNYNLFAFQRNNVSFYSILTWEHMININWCNQTHDTILFIMQSQLCN